MSNIVIFLRKISHSGIFHSVSFFLINLLPWEKNSIVLSIILLYCIGVSLTLILMFRYQVEASLPEYKKRYDIVLVEEDGVELLGSLIENIVALKSTWDLNEVTISKPKLMKQIVVWIRICLKIWHVSLGSG